MTTTFGIRAEIGVRYAIARTVSENKPEMIPSAADEVYVSVSIRPSAGGSMLFNAQTGRILYDVVASGVEVHWSSTSISHARLSGRDDLLNVTIHADTLVIAEPMKLPGANVTIQARVLRFENERAVIDTTPISKHQPAQRSSDALPAADGQDGTKGGDIFLRVGELWLGDRRIAADTKIDSPRLIATGGNGQSGESPRLGGEQPLSLVPVTAMQLREVIRGFGPLSNPDDYSFPDLSKFDAGQVVHVNFMTLNVGASGNVTCTWIPGGTTTSRMFTSPRVLEELWEETPKGRQKPGNGRPALPGGRPGNGGRGGDIEVINAALARSWGGNGGQTLGLAGGPAGAPKRAYHARILVTRKILSFETMPPRADFVEVSGSPGQSQDRVVGKVGLPGAVRTPMRDWLTAELLAPLIRYAGDLFANGFRDRARAALEPYRFVHGATGGLVSAATVRLIELSRRIDSNLDDFGQRPGWVPRLNASSTFAILTSQLKANLELMSLSGAFLRDWDALVDRHKALSLTLKSLDGEHERLWRDLDEGYQGLKDAQRQLEAIDADIEGVDLEMAAFRNGIAAMEAANDVRSKIVQGAAAMVGGLLQLCPVGQPYVGAASAVFKAVEGFAADESPSFTKLGEGLRTHVQTFLTDQEDTFKSSGNSELRQQMSVARKRVRDYGDRIESITRQAEDSDRDAVLRRSWDARRAAEDALDRYDLLNLNDDSESRAELARTLAQETAAWSKHRTEQESAEYQRRLKEAERLLERAKEDREDRDRKTEDVLRRVKSAAAGVGDLIRGIGLMTSSMRPDDPEILAKVDGAIAELPPASDLGLQYRGIVDKASALSLRRGQAASMILLQGQRIAAALAGIATNTENAASLTDMRRDVADATLGAELRGTFEAIQTRSRRRIESQMNAFVRAFQYEHLTDVPPEFKGLALVLPRLSAYRLQRVKPGTPPTAGDPVLATDSDHAAAAIKDAYLSLLDLLLKQRASRAVSTAYTATYALTCDEMSELATTGRLRLNLVAAGHVSLNEVKHRIRLVEVLDMAMTMAPGSKSDQVRFSVTHAQTSLLRGGDGYYVFQQAADEAPISWAWRYQAPPPGMSMPAWQSETKRDDDGIMQELLQRVLPGTTLKLREYSPSSFSDMMLALEVGGLRRHVSSVVRSIDKLTLQFTFEHEPQAPQMRKAAAAGAQGAYALAK